MKALHRWLPAIATCFLLLIALLAPIRRAGSVPVGDEVFSSSCDLLLEQSLGDTDSTFALNTASGVTQPLPLAGNVAVCSLAVTGGYYSGVDVRLVRWNPNTLTPEAGSVALRTGSYVLSRQAGSPLDVVLFPPLVVRESAAIAEGWGSSGFAFELTEMGFYGWDHPLVHYDPDGPSAIPAVVQFASDPNTAQTPLPGTHPVVHHRICGGNTALQALATVQSVTRRDTTLGGYEAVQRFRTPVAADLRWIEFVDMTVVAGSTGTIELYDAAGQATPPFAWSTLPVLAHASYFGTRQPCWVSHVDFDQSLSLQAGHDYWLVNRMNGGFGIGARRRDGSESADFQSGIGPSFVRPGPGAPWTNLPIAIDFRVIAQPTGAVAVGDGRPGTGALQLTVTPSPARGPVAVSWTGARGAVRFDVLDARGRRVGGGDAAASPAGRWSWSGGGNDGRALPAGVYFVRAHDAANTATQRVVLVR